MRVVIRTKLVFNPHMLVWPQEMRPPVWRTGPTRSNRGQHCLRTGRLRPVFPDKAEYRLPPRNPLPATPQTYL